MFTGNTITIIQGDALSKLKELPDKSVQSVITSPPYWNLRDYKIDGQIGLETSFKDYLSKLVTVFKEVYRVLRDDGTLWLNMGDCYISKNLVGQPWRLAFALQDDGWLLRSDIVWNKPCPMPESVRDRPTRSHEYIFLMSKSARYYYDADAIRTPIAEKTYTTYGCTHKSKGNDPLGSVKSDNWARSVQVRKPKTLSGWDAEAGSHGTIHRNGRSTNGGIKTRKRGHKRPHQGFVEKWDGMSLEEQCENGSNARDVWTIASKGYQAAHFATYPEELPRRCILAGSRPGDVILDPFGGSGTTAYVALGLGRRSVTIELNPDYVEIIRNRCGLFAIGS